MVTEEEREGGRSPIPHSGSLPRNQAHRAPAAEHDLPHCGARGAPPARAVSTDKDTDFELTELRIHHVAARCEGEREGCCSGGVEQARMGRASLGHERNTSSGLRDSLLISPEGAMTAASESFVFSRTSEDHCGHPLCHWSFFFFAAPTSCGIVSRVPFSKCQCITKKTKSRQQKSTWAPCRRACHEAMA